MKEIQLTQGQVALVDDENFERLNQFKWHAVKGKKIIYARRNSITINGKQHGIYMHHEIIGRPPKGFEVDHRNGQGLNNQQYNLRFVTRRQNQQNLHNKSKGSRFPGVYWHKRLKKWKSQIEINGHRKHLGYFVNEFEAFDAYGQAINDIGEKVIDKIL